VNQEHDEFLGACAKHFTERAVDRCPDCGDLYCAQCLVPPTRRRMPVRCIDCALIAAGVRAPGQRHGGGMASLSRAQKRPTSKW
jgi:hypothetical protein